MTQLCAGWQTYSQICGVRQPFSQLHWVFNYVGKRIVADEPTHYAEMGLSELLMLAYYGVHACSLVLLCEALFELCHVS